MNAIMDEFNFYLKLAKPLALSLTDAKDRTMAALWLKKLCDINNAQESTADSDNLHVEYLKLLLSRMPDNHLTGIFEKPPPEGSLRDILSPGQHTAKDMMSLTKGSRKSASQGQSTPKDHPRVLTSIGGDLCEYAAVQEIPNFGIHGYYAVSTEPLPKWSNTRKSEDPKARKCSVPCYMDSRDLKENFKNKIQSDKKDKRMDKIFQDQCSDIAGVETRPCWGRSRYIDRLIDESPHHVGDLDLSEADALLHLYRDQKLRKVKKKESNSKEKICALSSKRRQVEARLDMPPCASVLVEDDFPLEKNNSEEKDERTCLPRDIDSDETFTVGRCCRDDNSEYYPTAPIESIASTTLRYDGDDTVILSGSNYDRHYLQRDPIVSNNVDYCTQLRDQYDQDIINVNQEIDEDLLSALENYTVPYPSETERNGVPRNENRFSHDNRNNSQRDEFLFYATETSDAGQDYADYENLPGCSQEACDYEDESDEKDCDAYRYMQQPAVDHKRKKSSSRGRHRNIPQNCCNVESSDWEPPCGHC